MNPDQEKEVSGNDLPDLVDTNNSGEVKDELRLVLLGWRWPGKSLTGNTILGREDFRLERAAEFSVKRETVVSGRRVVVVDTPGWFSSQGTPASYQEEMVRSVDMCAPGPHAFLLVVPVGMFTETDRLRIEENLAILGEDVWKHTLLTFTWAEALRDRSIERHIRREGRELQWVVDKCTNRYHVINNNVFGEHPQVPQLLEKVDKIVAKEGGIFRAQAKQNGTKSGPVGGANTNVNQSTEREARELGARPKQNCSFSSLRPVDVDGPQNKMADGVSD